MHFSVIISTYNKPHFLERVLRGYGVQSRRDFQIVVADDGSGPETAEVIRRVQKETGLNLLHVWHEDRGFRKTEILNRAIVASRGDHLLFTDGDCIPRSDLLEVHYSLTQPGRYLAGGYLKLPEDVSAAITIDDVVSGRFAELDWLRAQGWRPGRRALRLVRSQRLAALFDALTPTAAHFHGNNASAAREALFEVNGFEGEMGYGGLDRALGFRLENHGVKGRQIRHRAICLHLHHDRPYRVPDVVQRNREIQQRIRRNGEVRARLGIAELTADSTLRVVEVGGGTAAAGRSTRPQQG
ncbi:MAG: glycosyltransferase [Gemmatimonadetes bacterium]|nr:glycosyltransferase [Gemmatimonadota bacterium]